MADEHTSPRLGRAVGVPRRFAVGTGLVILTMYSLLFALLDWLAFLPSVFVGVVAFVTGVGFAQMALFGGHKPREASFLAGGVLLPVIYHVLVWMEVATRRGLFARQLSIAEALTHIAVIPWLVVAGVGLAYVAGCGTAGVFLLLGRLAQRQAERRRREPRQSSPWDELPVETVPAEDVPEANREQSAGPGDPTPERPASRWDDRLWNRLTGTLRRLWPYQQGRPWGDALSVAILYVLFVGPAIPATFLEPDVGQARGVAVLLALFGFILTAAYLLIRLRVVLRTLLLMVIGAAGAWIVAESIGDQLYVSDHTYNWIVADLLEFHRWERGDAQNYPVTECLPPWAMAVCGGMVTPLLLIAFTLLPTRLFSRDKKLTNRKAWTKAGVGFLVLCHLVAYLGLAYLANTTSQQRMHWGYLHNAFWETWPPTLGSKTAGSIILSVEKASDEAMAGLAFFEEVTMLHLSGKELTDRGLAGWPSRFRNLTHLYLIDTSLTDRSLEEVARCKSITTLDFSGTNVTGKGMARIKTLPLLNCLDCSKTAIEDEALIHIGSMKGLMILDLTGTRVTDAGLAHLASLRTLGSLGLNETSISGEGLQSIGKLPSLRYLNLSGTNVTDDSLRHLSKAPALTEVWLDDTSIGDQGIAHLAAIPSLSSLSLRKTRITSESVSVLSKMTGLTDLDIRQTPLAESPDAVAKLEQALPQCSIWMEMY